MKDIKKKKGRMISSMSLDIYDKALYKKISEVFPNVINSTEDSTFDNVAEKNMNIPTKELEDENPKVVLPLVSFWRTGNPPNILAEGEGNYPAILRGVLRKDGYNLTGKYIRTFPISISYQISIWSDRRKEVDDIYREFLMMFIIDEPYLSIKVDEDYFEEFSLQLVDSFTNIDTMSFPNKGRLYRQDIVIDIPNAKLFYDGESTKLVKNMETRNILSLED